MKIPLISKWLEKRSQLTDPPPWLLRAFNGLPLKSGVSVNESTALKMTAVYSCVRVLSETISSLPFPVYRRLPNGGKERSPEHPLYSVLHDSPNPEMSAMVFRETLQSHLLLWGNAYALIMRDMVGRIQLWPLLPDRTYPKRDEKTKALYYVTVVDGREIPLRKEDVLHIPGLGFDGVKGYSPIQMAREAIGLGLAAEEFGARFFGQGTNVGGVVEHPNQLGEQAHKNLTNSLSEAYQGLGKTHKLLILEEGMKYQRIGIPPNDAQMIETRKFQIAEIARIFRVPLHLVDEDSKAATYASVEQFALQFVVHTIRPWLVRWEQAIKMRLFDEGERDQYFAEHLIEGLLRGDYKSRQDGLAIQRQNGIINADEWREIENMNPQEGNIGKIYWQPLNMVPAGTDLLELKSGNDPPDDAERHFREQRSKRSAASRARVAKSYERVYRDAAAGVVKRETEKIRKAAKVELQERNAGNFLRWLEDFYSDTMPEFINRRMYPAVSSLATLIQAAAAEEVGAKADMTPEMDKFVADYTATYATRHTSSSRGQLRKIVEDAVTQGIEPLPLVEERLNEWDEKRADKIAMNETVRTAGAIVLKTFALAGTVRLIWRAQGAKSCPYCQEMDGKIVGIEQPFVREGEDFEPEGAGGKFKVTGPVRHPPLHLGCACQISAY